MPDKADEFVTLTLPRSAIQDVVPLSAAIVDRIHVLLERTNDGNLTALERNEAETLVTLAQFSQLVAMSLKAGQSTV